MADEIDGGAAETAAGQTCAEAAGMFAGDFDKEIKFGHTVSEEIAGAFVALEHVLAELLMIVGEQSFFGVDDALDFSDDMVSAFVFALSQLGPAGIEHFDINGA